MQWSLTPRVWISLTSSSACFASFCFFWHYVPPVGDRLFSLSLSFLNYAMALTSKEITIVTPVYLTVVGGTLLFTEGDKRRWLRTAMQLLPFFLLTGAYWLGHVQRMPKNTWAGNGDYRMQIYWPAIIANLKNYPFWMTRMYGIVPDRQA